MRASQIAQVLARNAEGVAARLLPNGKRSGSHWIAGDVTGQPGKSLKVLVTGDKAGQWMDFESGEGGDLLDLWRLTEGISLVQAMKAAAEWAGVEGPALREPKKEFTRPDKPKCRAVKDTARQYLLKRGISEEAIDAYRVADNGREIIFPSLRDGELIAVKYRAIDRKAFRQEAGQEPCLWGWQAVPDDARAVVICEGEIDALSWASWGIPALSVPMGGGVGGKQAWIENEFDNLDRFDTVYLSLDADEPGQQAAAEIAERLGRERCRIVSLPKKDANECLTSGFTREQAAQAIAKARTMDPVELRSAADYEDQIVADYYHRKDEGWETPWSYLADTLKFRAGELVVLAGATGHGKSQVMGQLTACALHQGARCLVASLEFKPSRWLGNLMQQVSGVSGEVQREYLQDIVRWFDSRLWVFDVVGTARAEQLIEVFTYARRRYGVEWFVIDNLSKCGIADDDYAGQKVFVDQMSDFARDNDVTVFIVHHMRKGREDDQPDRSDIKGSGGITDMAHTVCTIWRNKAKEQDESGELDEKPDAIFKVRKQRETGAEPAVGLWYYNQAGQFCQKGNRPRPYIPPRAKPGADAEGGSVH